MEERPFMCSFGAAFPRATAKNVSSRFFLAVESADARATTNWRWCAWTCSVKLVHHFL